MNQTIYIFSFLFQSPRKAMRPNHTQRVKMTSRPPVSLMRIQAQSRICLEKKRRKSLKRKVRRLLLLEINPLNRHLSWDSFKRNELTKILLLLHRYKVQSTLKGNEHNHVMPLSFQMKALWKQHFSNRPLYALRHIQCTSIQHTTSRCPCNACQESTRTEFCPLVVKTWLKGQRCWNAVQDDL